MSRQDIKLGDEIEDVTSKTSGIAIARVEYLSGAVAWVIQPSTVDDNQMIRTQEVPDEYCIYLNEGVRLTPERHTGFHARGLDDGGN